VHILIMHAFETHKQVNTNVPALQQIIFRHFGVLMTPLSRNEFHESEVKTGTTGISLAVDLHI